MGRPESPCVFSGRPNTLEMTSQVFGTAESESRVGLQKNQIQDDEFKMADQETDNFAKLYKFEMAFQGFGIAEFRSGVRL